MSNGFEATGFWADGQLQLLSALAKEERDELHRLAKELSGATEPARRAELKKCIAEVLANYKRARRESDHSLFFSEGGLSPDSEADR